MPPEVQSLREIGELERIVAHEEASSPEKAKLLHKIALLRAAAEARLERRRAN